MSETAYERESELDRVLYDHKWTETPAADRPVGDTFALMVDALDVGEGMRIMVDLGCGTGRHAIYAARRGVDVVAVDHNRTACEILRRRAAGLPVVVENANLGHWLDAVSSRFDAVTCWDAVHHLSADVSVVRHALVRMRDLLLPGGFVLVTLLCDTEYGFGPTGSQLMISSDEGTRLLRAAFAGLREVVLKSKVMATDDSVGVDPARRQVVRASYASTRVIGLYQHVAGGRGSR
jgi:cyclopropane fatty-acyl-phospholipid synthase-like methyltransferase